MSWQFCLILFIGVLLEWKLTLSAPAEIGKTKEKGRSYEFGFSIEEQQHRHEKRDENGIVMGEFGFITADGIYHVTVYATDENGKFKIISMKNYPYGNPEEKIMIARLPPPIKPVVTPTEIKAMRPDGKSCGGCVLPKKSNLLPADVMGKKPDNEKTVFRPLSKTLNNLSSNGNTNGGAASSGKSTPTKQSKSLSKTIGSLQPGAGANGKGSSASQKPLAEYPEINPFIQPRFSTPEAQKPTDAVGTTSSKVNPKSTANNAYNRKTSPTQLEGPTKTPFTQNAVKPILKTTKDSKPLFQTLSKLLPDNNGSKQSGASNSQLSPQTPKLTSLTRNTSGQGVTVKPQTIGKNTLTQPKLTAKTLTPKRLQQNTNEAKTTTTNTQSTNKQTPVAPSTQAVGKPTPSINAGGASSNIANVGSSGGGPLYRFNYVLDYNSHREEGRIDGSKEGKYNTIHDDGIRRIIDYIANENGYQPHIKLERPPPNELPTGENKLKEYEFVWF